MLGDKALKAEGLVNAVRGPDISPLLIAHSESEPRSAPS